MEVYFSTCLIFCFYSNKKAIIISHRLLLPKKSRSQYALTANARFKYSTQLYSWRADRENSPALSSSSFSKAGKGF